MTRKATLTVLILTLVVGVAAWSKLRFIGKEGYDEPQRWRVEDYPRHQGLQTVGAGKQGHTTTGG